MIGGGEEDIDGRRGRQKVETACEHKLLPFGSYSYTSTHPSTHTHTHPHTHSRTYTHTLTSHVDLVQKVVGIRDVGEGHSKSSLLPRSPFSLPVSYKHTRQTHCKPTNHKLEEGKEKSGGERGEEEGRGGGGGRE